MQENLLVFSEYLKWNLYLYKMTFRKIIMVLHPIDMKTYYHSDPALAGEESFTNRKERFLVVSLLLLARRWRVSSRLTHVTILTIRGASHGSVPRDNSSTELYRGADALLTIHK